MAKAYGYIRVSTDVQAEREHGLNAQRDEITRYYTYKLEPQGVEWGGMYVDGGISAYKKSIFRRKEGKNFNAILERGDHAVISKMDRGFRSTEDFLSTYRAWESRGIGVHLLDCGLDLTTSMGKLMATIIAAIAEAESSRRGERQREARTSQIRRGLVYGKRPGIGHREGRNGARVKDDYEMDAIRLIIYLHDSMGLSFDRIYYLFTTDKIIRKEWSKQSQSYLPKLWGRQRIFLAYHDGIKMGLQPGGLHLLSDDRHKKLGPPPTKGEARSLQ